MSISTSHNVTPKDLRDLEPHNIIEVSDIATYDWAHHDNDTWVRFTPSDIEKGDFAVYKSLCKSVRQPLKVIFDYENRDGSDSGLRHRVECLPIRHLVVKNMLGWIDDHSDFLSSMGQEEKQSSTRRPGTVDFHINSGSIVLRSGDWGDQYRVWEGGTPSVAYHLIPDDQGNHKVTILDARDADVVPRQLYTASVRLEGRGADFCDLQNLSLEGAESSFDDVVRCIGRLIQEEHGYRSWKSVLASDDYQPDIYKTLIWQSLPLDGQSIADWHKLLDQGPSHARPPSPTLSTMSASTAVQPEASPHPPTGGSLSYMNPTQASMRRAREPHRHPRR